MKLLSHILCPVLLTLVLSAHSSAATFSNIPISQKTTVNGVSFAWNSAGTIDNMHCTQIHEAAEPANHTWNDNYFCSSINLDISWSSAGPQNGKVCTQILEPSDPHTWNDNYLCLPSGSDFEFTWSSAGSPVSNSVQWNEASDPHTWSDNYLQIRRPKLSPPFIASTVNPNNRLDQIYYIQPHNSYQNSYGTLTTLLNKGYRSLELDVIDKGNWENDINGPYVSHGSGGENGNCISGAGDDRLGQCLDEIVTWWNANSGNIQVPLMLYIDMKASWDPANAWYHDEILQLDNYVKGKLGSLIYSYYDLTSHLKSFNSTNNYRDTLKNNGWPNVDNLKGKIVVVFTGGRLGNVNSGMEAAMNTRGDLLNAILCPDIDTSDANEFSSNIDSISASTSNKFVCGNVKAGDHFQITANRASEYKQLMHLWSDSGDFSNTDYAYAWIATAHGASAVGIDPSSTNNTPSWTTNAIPFVGQRRSLPGYFNIKTDLNTGLCLTTNGGYSNGANISLQVCNGGNNQQFVYTAEGQLRPREHNHYCVDFNSGSADNGDRVHLWDCDGGNSEKWAITENGEFKNRDSNWTHCMDVAGANASAGQGLVIHQCHGQANQKFHLKTMADWAQSSF